MREEKYYSKAMKIIEKNEAKAIKILKIGASKNELKSITKLIDIKADEYVSYLEDVYGVLDIKFEYSKIAKETLKIYRIFPSYNICTDNTLLIEISKYLERAIKKDKSLIYDLGCLYTCLSLNCYEYTVIERISNGKLDDSIYSGDTSLYFKAKHKDPKYFKKALNLFKNNLDDYRNIEMYLGLLYCWKSSEEGAKKKRYQELHDTINKNIDYISKTNYLRMPMKIYFLNEDYDNAKEIANKLLEKTNDDTSTDSQAAHNILYRILKIKGASDEELEEQLIKSGEFGYDDAAKLNGDFGLLNTIHKLYRDMKPVKFEVNYKIDKKNKADLKKLIQFADDDMINIIKENNEPSYIDCLWEYYVLKYAITHDADYYIMYIDEYIKCASDKGKDITKFDSIIDEDFLNYLFKSSNKSLYSKAIEYSKYKKISATTISGLSKRKSYDELKKNGNSFSKYTYDFPKVNALRAVYEYKNNNEKNDIIKQFLITGLCHNDSKEIYNTIYDDITFIDCYKIDDINYFDDDYLNKLKRDYTEDGRKYGFNKIDEIKDKLSVLSLLAIDRYSLDEKEKFKDVIKKANNENFISNFKSLESNFDLDNCKKSEYNIIDEESKTKITIISKGIKDVIFDCLFKIYKSENKLDDLVNILIDNKDKIRTKKYLNEIKKEYNKSDKRFNNLEEKFDKRVNDLEGRLEENHKDLKADAKKILSSQKAIKKTQKEMLANQEEMKDMLENMSKKIAELKIPAEVDDEEELSKVSDEIRKIASETAEKIKQDYSNEKIESINRLLIELFGTEYHKLSADSKKMLVTAYITYDYLKEKTDVDFSGVCITVSKVVEREIKKRVYTNYIAYLRNNHRSTILELGNKTIAKNSDFTLGSVAYLLGNITGDLKHHQPVGGSRPNEDFVSYVKDRHILNYTDDNAIETALKEIGEGCNCILGYRNDSAHTGAVQLEEAANCINYIVQLEKFLKKTLAKFRY